ncbi:ABC transporter permease subunit [Luedemannella helvata]|uniref:ABC transporter permease n=1 Tax=Luedemannella helvata TaxID=349315 RepID=A0ABP4WCA3_9ACTN
MRLLRTELSRFFARRFLHVLSIFILLIMGTVLAAVAGNSTPVGPEQYAAAKDAAQRDFELNKQMLQLEYENCVEDVTSPTPSGTWGNGGIEVCAGILEKARAISPSDPVAYLPDQFNLRYELDTWLYLAALVLCLFAFTIGASFVGAEWTSGGMTNLALWYPRRVALLATKLTAALLGTAAVGAAYLALWTGGLGLVAQWRGVVDGATAGFWQSTALLCLRVLVLALASAAIGFALASLGRHTASALGIGIGYAIVVELGTLLVFGVLNASFPERFRLSTYIGAWLTQRVELYEYDVCAGVGPGCGNRFYVVDLAASSAVLGTVVVLLAGAALFAFRRRDIA